MYLSRRTSLHPTRQSLSEPLPSLTAPRQNSPADCHSSLIREVPMLTHPIVLVLWWNLSAPEIMTLIRDTGVKLSLFDSGDSTCSTSKVLWGGVMRVTGTGLPPGKSAKERWGTPVMWRGIRAGSKWLPIAQVPHPYISNIQEVFSVIQIKLFYHKLTVLPIRSGHLSRRCEKLAQLHLKTKCLILVLGL